MTKKTLQKRYEAFLKDVVKLNNKYKFTGDEMLLVIKKMEMRLMFVAIQDRIDVEQTKFNQDTFEAIDNLNNLAIDFEECLIKQKYEIEQLQKNSKVRR